MELLIILGVFVFIFAIRASSPNATTQSPHKDWCPPHVWQYGPDNFLICKVCNSKPGYKGRENNS